MADLRLERRYPIPPDQLWTLVTTPEGLLQWWGPEGMHVPEHDMDFTRTGPWFSVMVNSDGQRFKVSGHVTHVDPPRTVTLTWGWHDDADLRGDESQVTFSVTPDREGARFVLDHRDLPDTEQGHSHKEGWTSSLRKLDAAAAR